MKTRKWAADKFSPFVGVALTQISQTYTIEMQIVLNIKILFSPTKRSTTNSSFVLEHIFWVLSLDGKRSPLLDLQWKNDVRNKNLITAKKKQETYRHLTKDSLQSCLNFLSNCEVKCHGDSNPSAHAQPDRQDFPRKFSLKMCKIWLPVTEQATSYGENDSFTWTFASEAELLEQKQEKLEIRWSFRCCHLQFVLCRKCLTKQGRKIDICANVLLLWQKGHFMKKDGIRLMMKT